MSMTLRKPMLGNPIMSGKTHDTEKIEK